MKSVMIFRSITFDDRSIVTGSRTDNSANVLARE